MTAHKHIVRGLVGALSLSLALAGTPLIAQAVTSEELQAELEEVRGRLDDLYYQSEQVSEDLNDTRYQLGQTKKSIKKNEKTAAQKSEELEAAKKVLSEVIAEDYKAGNTTLLSVVLGSSSIEDLASNVYYANKVTENRREAIENVKSVQEVLDKTLASLEKERAEQESLVGKQEALQADLDERVAATEEYVDSLSVRIREALAAEEAARQEAARKAAEEAQRAAEEAARQEAEEQARREREAAEQEQQQQEQQQGDDTPTEYDEPEPTYDDPEPEPEPEPEEDSNGGQISAGVANTIINAAASQIGCPYVYGAMSPGVAFDCSGLVAYAYACAGYSLPHSSSALSAYCYKPVSQAVPGDILWMPGHVGIYIGNGTTIEAFNPGTLLGYGSASKFYSAGSPAAL
jgi:cell wall-associated NlpC family hydrolase